MEWLNPLLNGEMSKPMMAALFVALLVILLIIIWLFRKIFSSGSRRISKNRQPRLSVTDAAIVDDKRRLVLVRRDNVEHLVMIGGPTDIVVEQHIIRAAPVEVPATRLAPEPAPVSTTPAAPQPVEARPPEPDTTKLDNNGLSAAGATALAAGAGVATVAESAGSSLTGIVKDSAASVSDTASNAVESVSETVSGVTDSVAENVTSGVHTAASAVGDVGSSLVADLDNALAADNEPVIDTSSQNKAPEVGSAHASDSESVSKTEDEMQRLLDELSTTKT